MTARIIDRAHGYAHVLEALRDLGRGRSITMGVHEDKGAEEHRSPKRGDTVADVAVLAEFGKGRGEGGTSFVRSVVDTKRTEIQAAIKEAAKRGVKSARFGSGPRGHVARALERVAARYAREMRARLRGVELVDTRHLLESIEGRSRAGYGS